MRYLPHTEQDIKEMLEAIGIPNMGALFDSIPDRLRLEAPAVNKELETNPELVNQDPHGKGWMIEVELSDPEKLDGLMSAGDYETFIKEQG